MSKWSRNASAYEDRVSASREAHAFERVGGVKVTETPGSSRLLIKFDFDKEGLDIIKAIPGASWSWDSHSWSVSMRYRKRAAEAVARIEQLLADKAATREAELRAIDEAAEADPLPTAPGFKSVSVNGRWVIVSPYDPALVTSFKRIKDAKWNGSAWTFPAGARQELADIITKFAEK